MEIRFIKPFEGVAQTLLTTESMSENQTKVIWEMNGQSKYPFNLMNLFLNNMLGNDLLESLSNLKYNLEITDWKWNDSHGKRHLRIDGLSIDAGQYLKISPARSAK